MRYICQVCGYLYDDAKEKVPFAELLDDWKCPLCGAAKSDFRPEGEKAGAGSAAPGGNGAAKIPVKKEAENTPEGNDGAEDWKKLSPGQLAALCSNLARGCEKQYKAEEAGLFRKLADYFTSVVPAEEDASLTKLAADLQGDVDAYLSVRATAEAYGDRGAQRATVWGEKVTRMLSSLVSRYLTEGERMLAGTEIWVCTACGFVFIGDAPPELCPVCKVPAWKFEKVEGRG